MHKIFIISILTMLCVAFPTSLEAKTGNIKQTTLIKTKMKAPAKGHRIPSKQLTCVIDFENGISIEGVENESITAYEIYDLSDACLASFSSEHDFLAFLAECTGEYQIQFVTEDYVYSGYIEL